MSISHVGVVGAGLMGSGIAEVTARHGLHTIICEQSSATVAAAQERIGASLDRAVKGGKIDVGDRAAVIDRIRYTTSLDDFHGCDIVIEAVREQVGEKREVFAVLDRITPPHAILATNTSSLAVIDIATATNRPNQVVGLHFFNPAPVMPLLEIVPSVATDEATLNAVRDFATLVGKTVIVAQDRAGFVVNRLLVPFLTSAVRMCESGVATPDDIDAGMRLGCGHPMGPLELIDHVGLDTTLFVCESLHREYANPDHAAPPLLRRMVSAGWLGRKSGRGFYRYENGRRVNPA